MRYCRQEWFYDESAQMIMITFVIFRLNSFEEMTLMFHWQMQARHSWCWQKDSYQRLVHHNSQSRHHIPWRYCNRATTLCMKTSCAPRGGRPLLCLASLRSRCSPTTIRQLCMYVCMLLGLNLCTDYCWCRFREYLRHIGSSDEEFLHCYFVPKNACGASCGACDVCHIIASGFSSPGLRTSAAVWNLCIKFISPCYMVVVMVIKRVKRIKRIAVIIIITMLTIHIDEK